MHKHLFDDEAILEAIRSLFQLVLLKSGLVSVKSGTKPKNKPWFSDCQELVPNRLNRLLCHVWNQFQKESKIKNSVHNTGGIGLFILGRY